MSGDTERTIALCEEGLAVSKANGESWSRSWSTWVLGYEIARQGEYGRAAALAQESLQLKRALDDRLGVSYCVELLAWAASANGQHEYAAVLLGAAQELRRAVGVPLRRILIDGHTQCEANLRRALGDHGLEEAILSGTELTFDQTALLRPGRHARGTLVSLGAASAISRSPDQIRMRDRSSCQIPAVTAGSTAAKTAQVML